MPSPSVSGSQAWLPLAVHLRRPILTMSGARNVTGLDENLIRELIDDGSLVAWDISRAAAAFPSADRQVRKVALRQEIRILAASAHTWPKIQTIPDDALVTMLYGPDRPFLRGINFCRIWNCDSGHVINLVADKVLATVAKTHYGRGRGNTPCITWASAVNFLKSRRL